MSQMASRAVTAAEAAGCLAQGHYNKEGGLLNTPPPRRLPDNQSKRGLKQHP